MKEGVFLAVDTHVYTPLVRFSSAFFMRFRALLPGNLWLHLAGNKVGITF